MTNFYTKILDNKIFHISENIKSVTIEESKKRIAIHYYGNESSEFINVDSEEQMYSIFEEILVSLNTLISKN